MCVNRKIEFNNDMSFTTSKGKHGWRSKNRKLFQILYYLTACHMILTFSFLNRGRMLIRAIWNVFPLFICPLYSSYNTLNKVHGWYPQNAFLQFFWLKISVCCKDLHCNTHTFTLLMLMHRNNLKWKEGKS